MKKIVIFFILAGCKFASFDNKHETLNAPNTKNASESSVVNSPRVQNPVLSQQELNSLWIKNLQSTDNYYWDNSEFSYKKNHISSIGEFSTSNNRSVRNYYLIKANSSTEALYYYSYYNQNSLIYQRTVLLNMVRQNGSSYQEVVRATYTNNPGTLNLDGFETDVLYRNPQ